MLAVTESNTTVLEQRRVPVPKPLAEERRDWARTPRKLNVTLKPLGYSSAIVASAHDVSEGGMYLLLPADPTLCVGQRCELALGEALAAFDCFGGDCYATIVRTHPVTHGEGQMVGAGVRFDQPVYWD